MTLDKIDQEKRSFTAATSFGMHLEFVYRDDTLIRGTSAADYSRVDDLLETRGSLPLASGQKVRVTWKESTADKKKRIAKKIAVQK